mmetsp:Transcript_63891/g.114017  ORF Transcript_63891/g.114017 Transcript_63891/m.114017 type:complete len:230 (-) Transcript_63891:3-692(-)
MALQHGLLLIQSTSVYTVVIHQLAYSLVEMVYCHLHSRLCDRFDLVYHILEVLDVLSFFAQVGFQTMHIGVGDLLALAQLREGIRLRLILALQKANVPRAVGERLLQRFDGVGSLCHVLLQSLHGAHQNKLLAAVSRIRCLRHVKGPFQVLQASSSLCLQLLQIVEDRERLLLRQWGVRACGTSEYICHGCQTPAVAPLACASAGAKARGRRGRGLGARIADKVTQKVP